MSKSMRKVLLTLGRIMGVVPWGLAVNFDTTLGMVGLTVQLIGLGMILTIEPNEE